jgi:peptidoglycan/xylan/chitin deacetylase (PgdA/CDA1 family)
MSPWLRAIEALGAGALAMATATASAACAADALGTSRTLTLPRAPAAYGSVQHGPLPLEPDEVVITFDDGPRAGSTPAILRALADQCVRATFFMNGEQMLRTPELARRVRAAGHSLGMHGHRHSHFDELPAPDQLADLAAMEAAWRKVFGADAAPAWRFPYLEETPVLLEALAQRRVTVMSTDTGVDDWLPRQTPAMLAERLLERLRASGGGIVLLHDAQDQTAAALPLLLSSLKTAGYRVVHLEWQAA